MAFCSLLSRPSLSFLTLLSAVPIAIFLSSYFDTSPSSYVYSGQGFFRECTKWDPIGNRFFASTNLGGSVVEIREGDAEERVVIKDADVTGNSSVGVLVDRSRDRLLVVYGDALLSRYSAVGAYRLDSWERIFLTCLGGPEVPRMNQNGNELSTEEVMRIAAAHFIQLSTTKDNFGISLSSLSTDKIKNVELASFLLAAAEKVSNHQYERASNLLKQCYSLSSVSGNPVQRVVYYFCDALQERIDRETGKLSLKSYNERCSMTPEMAIKAMLASHPLKLVCHKTLPFAQVVQFTSVQAIIDNVSNAKRIHVIDLSIRHGLEWTILMQALASRTLGVETLKISAVTVAEEVVAATGERLTSFAEGLGLPFEFKTVTVPDMKELKEEMFELKEGERVALYSSMDMNSMIVKPETLENVMKVIWKIKPHVMTVTDCEAKHNSPSFINRFTEALFYFSAMFDCIDGAMSKGDENRHALEKDFMAQGIKSIVAMEGKERVVRHVGIGVWREFFKRFGMVEVELNQYSVYQGALILKQFVNGRFCTVEMDGKSLLVGWKGTPIHFVSAWKFQGRE